MRSRFGVGLDWPVTYKELEPHLEMAEREIGVAADVEDQTYLGLKFPKGYVFPMHGLPLSYLDRQVRRGPARHVGRARRRTFCARRAVLSARPQRDPQQSLRWRQGVLARRRGVDQQRWRKAAAARATTPACRSAPCRPSTMRAETLAKALASGRVDILTRAVASRVVVDGASGRVTGIEVKRLPRSRRACA